MGLIIKNNVIYNGAESEPIIYSEEEREVGVWTDGKPLYQRTLFYTGDTLITVSGDSSSTYPVTGITDIYVNDILPTLDQLVHYQIDLTFDGNEKNIYHFEYCFQASTGTFIRSHNPGIAYIGYNITPGSSITLQYTKTTDQPGSGIWTPSGVKTVHYSTDEQVIGTWIDGSTLYERTLYKDLSGQAEHWYVYLDTLIDDINDYTIINFQGQFQFKEESYIYAHVIPNPQGSYYINRDNSRWYLYFHTGNATCDWGYMTATIRYVKEILGQPSS